MATRYVEFEVLVERAARDLEEPTKIRDVSVLPQLRASSSLSHLSSLASFTKSSSSSN